MFSKESASFWYASLSKEKPPKTRLQVIWCIPYLACCCLQSCLLFLFYHPRELTILNGHLCECWQGVAEETVVVLYKARHASSMFLVSEMLIGTWPNPAPGLLKLLGLLSLASWRSELRNSDREQAIKSVDFFTDCFPTKCGRKIFHLLTKVWALFIPCHLSKIVPIFSFTAAFSHIMMG